MTAAPVADALRQLHDQHHGLTPVLVVNTARDPQHPLHGHFEWDDARAGEQYRLQQARSLIRSFKVVYRDDGQEQRKVRAYVSTVSEAGPVYRATEEVLSDDFSRELLMRGLQRDLNTLRRKYGHLEEFAALVQQRLLGGEAS